MTRPDREDHDMTTCAICHDPATTETCSRECAEDLALATGHINDYPEETHMTSKATPMTGYYKCSHCDALSQTRHTWHQCPTSGRLELLGTGVLRETGSTVIEPYWPREAELTDRLAAAKEEHQRFADTETPVDDDEEQWRWFAEADGTMHRRNLDLAAAADAVRRRYSLGAS